MRNIVLEGDVRAKLREIPEKSVQTCVTSPPYWGLRDYGHDGQIGHEETPDAYVGELVSVFREVHRVLRDDGTLWLNLGDSYFVKNPAGNKSFQVDQGYPEYTKGSGRNKQGLLKYKDLVGIPWMVAFALRSDGWYLRSDIIWHKPNVMPESVTDRPTKAHEYVFLLTKSERYFYDNVGVREPSSQPDRERADRVGGNKYGAGVKHSDGGIFTGSVTRNRRTVWAINPKPYKGAHFAIFPEELPETCIKAGTSEKGCCPACGAPWKRVVEKGVRDDNGVANGVAPENHAGGTRGKDPTRGGGNVLASVPRVVLGIAPSCECPPSEPVPCIVLDPFAGSGTTLAVAKYLRRDYVGVELNPEYLKLIEERLRPALELEVERQGFDTMQEMEQEQ